uniref:Putative ovule protein n=1 Tax=Solanum chacoense TaxID=4108 RepID=A0A0V0HTM5_SOLCH
MRSESLAEPVHVSTPVGESLVVDQILRSCLVTIQVLGGIFIFIYMFWFASACLYCYLKFCLLLFSFFPQTHYLLAYLLVGYSRCHHDSRNQVVTKL